LAFAAASLGSLAGVKLVNDPDTGWINYLADYYGYDAEKNDTSDVFQFWDYIQGTWSNLGRTVNSYDANGNLISYTRYNWDTMQFWKPYIREDYEYDSSSNLLQDVILTSADGIIWDSSFKFVYTYDSSNNRITETDYFFTGGVFIPTNFSTATYNAENLQIQNIIQYWSGTQWKNQYQDTLSYDANNNLIVFERREWYSGSYSWTYSKSEFSYNASNQLTQRTEYEGDQITYLLSYLYSYEYNSDGYLSYELQQRYNASLAVFQNTQQTFYYYTIIISGVSIVEDHMGLNTIVYPNPASQSIQVNVYADRASEVQLLLTNTEGKILLFQSFRLQAGDNIINQNIAQLPSGFYAIRILNSETSESSISRFIKE
jgi:hypothetical protein